MHTSTYLLSLPLALLLFNEQGITTYMAAVALYLDQCVYFFEMAFGAGLADLYLHAMDAIYQAAPFIPFFLEGTGQSGIGANWGDGFVCDTHMISSQRLSDPNPFFQVRISSVFRQRHMTTTHVLDDQTASLSPRQPFLQVKSLEHNERHVATKDSAVVQYTLFQLYVVGVDQLMGSEHTCCLCQ